MSVRVLLAIVAAIVPSIAVVAQRTSSPTPAATRVVKYVPPATLPARPAVDGTCQTDSTVAGYRPDAVRCLAGSQIYDPCFMTSRSDRVLCDVDPRDPTLGVVVNLTTALPQPAAAGARDFGNHAWFFELADGSTCQPLSSNRREVEGLLEVYACRFALPGEADAVLGDLAPGHPLWTIQQVLINKKIEPPTIKSTLIVPVKSVWQ